MQTIQLTSCLLYTSGREKILVLYTEKKSLHRIAREIERSVSTISRELRRNGFSKKAYSAVQAQKKYEKRRKNCRRAKLLSNIQIKETVQHLFLDRQWSPEQISNRLRYENSLFKISYTTIYRGIYSGVFDTAEQRRSRGNRGAIRKLRHRGKKRRSKGTTETRGKIVISNRIQERPQEADGRQVIGHWEADNVAGKNGSACLVTITDRCSRYLLAGKVFQKQAALVAGKMILLLSALPKKKRKTITPDRGKEFARHSLVTQP